MPKLLNVFSHESPKLYEIKQISSKNSKYQIKNFSKILKNSIINYYWIRMSFGPIKLQVVLLILLGTRKALYSVCHERLIINFSPWLVWLLRMWIQKLWPLFWRSLFQKTLQITCFTLLFQHIVSCLYYLEYRKALAFLPLLFNVCTSLKTCFSTTRRYNVWRRSKKGKARRMQIFPNCEQIFQQQTCAKVVKEATSLMPILSTPTTTTGSRRKCVR